MKKWRLYLDTSVLGGCFDTGEGWDVDSRRVVDYCIRGTAALLWTDTLEAELVDAPEEVRALYRSIPKGHRERVEDSGQVRALMQSYLDAGVVGSRWWEDCLHVAAATVARADAIVSWNFKHIVRLDRIHAFNAVNLTEGFAMITILSPKEVNLDEP